MRVVLYIRRMIGEFGFDAARFYDEEFRRVKPSHNLDWTVIHDELWRQAMSLSKQGNFRAQNFNPQSKQSSKSYPKGYCWKFCRTGSCSDRQCKRKHLCYKCEQKHAPASCTRGRQQTKPAVSRASR